MAAKVTVCTDMPMCCDDPNNEDCQVALEFEHMDDIVTDNCQVILKVCISRCFKSKLSSIYF